GVLPQRDDLFRQADPVRGAAVHCAAADRRGPPVHRPLRKLQPRGRSGVALWPHGLPRRDQDGRRMSRALATPSAGGYFDAALQTQAIRLLPADYLATDQLVALVTLLGSCVAACLYDPMLGLGGMNHFMLPGGDINDATSARYGVNAMELLINDLLKRGARRQ